MGRPIRFWFDCDHALHEVEQNEIFFKRSIIFLCLNLRSSRKTIALHIFYLMSCIPSLDTKC